MTFSSGSRVSMTRLFVMMSLCLISTSLAGASNRFVLLGAPGAGKGTVATELKRKFKIPHISSGDIVRAEIDAGTPFGKKVAEFNAKGQLMPDTSEFMGMLFDALKSRLSKDDCKDGFILDGIPRTEWQAQELEKTLEGIGKGVDVAILLNVRTEVLLDRLSGRLICKPCGLSYHKKNLPPKKAGQCDQCGGGLVERNDDKTEVVLKRLEIYSKEAGPVSAFYKKRNLLLSLDGEGEPEKVIQALEQELEAL